MSSLPFTSQPQNLSPHADCMNDSLTMVTTTQGNHLISPAACVYWGFSAASQLIEQGAPLASRPYIEEGAQLLADYPRSSRPTMRLSCQASTSSQSYCSFFSVSGHKGRDMTKRSRNAQVETPKNCPDGKLLDNQKVSAPILLSGSSSSSSLLSLPSAPGSLR